MPDLLLVGPVFYSMYRAWLDQIRFDTRMRKGQFRRFKINCDRLATQ